MNGDDCGCLVLVIFLLEIVRTDNTWVEQHVFGITADIMTRPCVCDFATPGCDSMTGVTEIT